MISISTLIRATCVALLVCSLTGVRLEARQAKQKLITQAPVEDERQSPVEVVSVMVNGKAVEPGRLFPAGDDWLIGVTFRLKNVSDKPIMFVDIMMGFPNPPGSKNKHTKISGLRYGCWPGSRCYPDAKGSDKPIMPGETQDVELREDEYRLWMRGLAQLGVPMPIEALEYNVETVFFDAQTMWSRGLLFRQDPRDPHSYRDGVRYVLPKKTE
ncbi:MAG TPA: hypothetical protein VGV59_19940 [Pyrinomonadaceae bacterium]|nr:hypothetical protein [Pyrinomonadaceae bacterium]